MDFTGRLGAIRSPKDVRDYKGVARLSAKDYAYPTEYTHYMPKVEDQGNVDSCVAHTLATILEYNHYLLDKEVLPMSTCYIYGNRENSEHKDSGMIVRDALLAICKYGSLPREMLSDNIEVPEAISKFEESAASNFLVGRLYRATSIYRLNKEEDIKSQIMSDGIAVFVVDWYSDIKVKDGVMTSLYNPDQSIGIHCIVAYGWNEKGWLIQNSWGEWWGDKGRAIMPYDYPRRETWGVSDDFVPKVGYMKIKKPFSSKIGQFFAKIINSILRKLIREEKVSEYKEGK